MKTIEEKAKEWAYDEYNRQMGHYAEIGFNKGAEWMQEQMIERALEALYGLANDLGCDFPGDIEEAQEYLREAMEN